MVMFAFETNGYNIHVIFLWLQQIGKNLILSIALNKDNTTMD